MIDKLILFPYWLTLKCRHAFYNIGLFKSHKAPVPTICVGNITVGGTGKTPHTEMIIRMLLESEEWGDKNIAVLSRGYKRKSKGFQQVTAEGRVEDFGDEPLQIKRKFPEITVAVDKSRKRGCRFLADPELLKTSKKGRRCINKDMPKADIIVLDDAFQHRRASWIVLHQQLKDFVPYLLARTDDNTTPNIKEYRSTILQQNISEQS